MITQETINFFWDKGHHCVKLDVITSERKNCGLKVTNIQDTVYALRLKWLCTLFDDKYKHKFKLFLLHNVNNYLSLHSGADTFNMLIHPTTLSHCTPFYRELFYSWAQPLFSNPFINSVEDRTLPIVQSFIAMGIVQIKDVLYEVIPLFFIIRRYHRSGVRDEIKPVN